MSHFGQARLVHIVCIAQFQICLKIELCYEAVSNIESKESKVPPIFFLGLLPLFSAKVPPSSVSAAKDARFPPYSFILIL